MEHHKINFGRSLIVPSVQELAKQSITKIPPRYVHHNHHPASDDAQAPSVPVIDLHCLLEGSSTELNNLHAASKEWGFFQVINHGISESLLEDFKREVLNMFKLPMEEKLKLWQEEDNHEGFGQLFVVSEEQKLDWSDMFYITTLPHNLRQLQLFQKLPLILREKLETYCNEMKRIAMSILDQMAKALGMDKEEMNELFQDGVQSVRINYYPPCPQPEMALGFSPHSDADALTILYQLNETAGLQIRKDGKWLTVKPRPDALVVNIGDIMEIVSNGVYKSIEHQAIVNSNNERMSVATFYSSSMGTDLGPARSLVEKHNVANFQRVPLETYFKEFFARKLDGKSYLDIMKLERFDHIP
ncbi:oxoglutarate-dependent flavonoid 7-O-demethylase 1-like [Bidens hawaiensis]|uniref:oxoglutarate-dependent flavonoid 7-O-demethylase 1-like n=1 Tax=Bidens hawaiensis TaxID=980011 RepID=UPI00404AE9B2